MICDSNPFSSSSFPRNKTRKATTRVRSGDDHPVASFSFVRVVLLSPSCSDFLCLCILHLTFISFFDSVLLHIAHSTQQQPPKKYCLVNNASSSSSSSGFFSLLLSSASLSVRVARCNPSCLRIIIIISYEQKSRPCSTAYGLRLLLVFIREKNDLGCLPAPPRCKPPPVAPPRDASDVGIMAAVDDGLSYFQ